MQLDQPRARIRHRPGADSPVKNFAFKALLVLGGGAVLASAFVLSVLLIPIALAVVLTFGGYLWWKTRELRKQLRDRMQTWPQSDGDVIEGEVISRDQARR